MTRVNRMYLLLPIVLLLTVNFIGASLDVWQKECPFSNFCTTESLEKVNETTDPTSQPCCGSCSCDKDCFIFENCCPDIRASPPVDLQKANCIHLKINNEMVGGSFAEEYRVINFCPRGFDMIDKRLVDQCEERYVYDLNDVVAVSDNKNRIYKNKHCALCQGVRDFVSWTFELVSCSKSFDKTSLSASQVTQAYLNHCLLHSVPPDDGGKYDTMLCGSSLLSSCSSTTTGFDSDVEDIREKCLNGPYIPFMHLGFNNILKYKNVYCYLCKTGENDLHMCPRPGNSMAKGVGLNVGILLNLQLGTTDQAPVKPETQCTETEIYDHVKGKCSRVFCPPYHVVFYGRCLEIGEFINYGAQLRIQSKPNDSIILSGHLMMYEEEASKAYARKVLLEYGLERCYIAAFNLQAIVDKNTYALAGINTLIDIVFNDKCDATSISHIVRTRLSVRHDTSVVINNITVHSSGQITFYDQSLALLTNTGLYDIWGVVQFYDQGMFRAAILFDFFLCPYFNVDIQQYNAINTDVCRDGNERNLTEISEFTRLKNGFYSLTNDSIAVCVDTYFEMYAKNRGLTTMVACSMLHGIGLSVSSFLIYALIY